MEVDNRTLVKISLFTGFIPFVLGWLIFFLWMLGLYLDLQWYQDLEIIGLIWIVMGTFVGVIGLTLWLIYIVFNLNKMNNEFVTKGLAIILVNIPSVFIVLKLVTFFKN